MRMNTDFRIEEPDLSSKYDLNLIRRFLTPMGFCFEVSEVDYAILLFNLNDDMVGVGACKGKVLKYIAVSPAFRETGAFALIVTHLTERVMAQYSQSFVFTRPENIRRFTGLGYRHIASAEPLMAVLEFGYTNIGRYKNYLQSIKRPAEGRSAAIVMNCNPFTLGHQYLVEKAAGENEMVYLFVVEEDRSTFGFGERWEMVKKGVRHLSNVVLVRGGEYVVTEVTFPHYFLKSEHPDVITAKQAELDLHIFCQHFAPVLDIALRYVGSEEYCATTAIYNKVMKEVLPAHNIGLKIIERKVSVCADGVELISASKVREAIRQGERARLRRFLPSSTIDLLEEGLLEKTRRCLEMSGARH